MVMTIVIITGVGVDLSRSRVIDLSHAPYDSTQPCLGVSSLGDQIEYDMKDEVNDAGHLPRSDVPVKRSMLQ